MITDHLVNILCKVRVVGNVLNHMLWPFTSNHISKFILHTYIQTHLTTYRLQTKTYSNKTSNFSEKINISLQIFLVLFASFVCINTTFFEKFSNLHITPNWGNHKTSESWHHTVKYNVRLCYLFRQPQTTTLSDLENFFSSSHLHEKYLRQGSLRFP